MSKLRQLWSNKTLRRLAISAAIFVAAVVGSCSFLRISRPEAIEAYLGMALECHPVWKQFAFRKFSAGDSAAQLLDRFPPTQREEFGRYGVYSYYARPGGIQLTGLSVLTRDGKLLTAESGSCTWRFTFFRTEDPQIDVEYRAYHEEQRKRREKNRSERLEAEKRIAEPNAAANGSIPSFH